MDTTLATNIVSPLTPPLRPGVSSGKTAPRMPGPAQRATARGATWTGRVLTGLAAAFLLVDGGGKILLARVYVEGTMAAGFPRAAVLPIGLILVASLAVHLIPRTAVLGAVLLTGYLGGAVATHVRLSNPLFTHTLFPIYFGALIWAGLYLRDARVRTLLGSRRS